MNVASMCLKMPWNGINFLSYSAHFNTIFQIVSLKNLTGMVSLIAFYIYFCHQLIGLHSQPKPV